MPTPKVKQMQGNPLVCNIRRKRHVLEIFKETVCENISFCQFNAVVILIYNGDIAMRDNNHQFTLLSSSLLVEKA